LNKYSAIQQLVLRLTAFALKGVFGKTDRNTMFQRGGKIQGIIKTKPTCVADHSA
jgi:hypothetical protein